MKHFIYFFLFTISWLQADIYPYRELTAPIIQLPPNIKVIQYSPPRTGSTLIYNVLQYLFEDNNFTSISGNARVHKTHTPPSSFANAVVISTMRHPIQAYASAWKADIKISLPGHAYSFQELVHFSRKNPTITVLKYESFMEDWNVIFEGIESAFSVVIPEDEKRRIEELFSIDSMKKIADKYRDFSNYDKYTHIHGNHITNENDLPWQEILPEHLHYDVVRHLGNVCKSLGYEIDYDNR